MYEPAMQDAGVTGEPVQENNNELTGQAAQLPPEPSFDRKPLKQKASADAFRALAARLNGAAAATPDALPASPAHPQEAIPAEPELAVQAPADFIAEQPAPVDLKFTSVSPAQSEFPTDAFPEQPLEPQPYTEQTLDQVDQSAEIANELETVFSTQDIEPELQNIGETEPPKVSPAATDGPDDSQPGLSLTDESPDYGQEDCAHDEEGYLQADIHDVASTDQVAEELLPELVPGQLEQDADIAEEKQLEIAVEPIQPALEEHPDAPAILSAQDADHLEPEPHDAEITFVQEVPAEPVLQPRQSDEIIPKQDEQSIESDDDFELTFATNVAPSVPDEHVTSAPATSVDSEPIDLVDQEQQRPAGFEGPIAADEPIDTASVEAPSTCAPSSTVQHVLAEEENEHNGQAFETAQVIEPELGLNDIPPLDALTSVDDVDEPLSASIEATPPIDAPFETVIGLDLEEDSSEPASEEPEALEGTAKLPENPNLPEEDVNPEFEITDQQPEQIECEQPELVPPASTSSVPPQNDPDIGEQIIFQPEDATGVEEGKLEENQEDPDPAQVPLISETDQAGEVVSKDSQLECEVDAAVSSDVDSDLPPIADDAEIPPVSNEDGELSDIMSSISEKFSVHPKLSAKTPKPSPNEDKANDDELAAQEDEFDEEFDESSVDPQAGETARMLLDIMSKPSGAAQPQERALAADTLLRLVTKIPAINLIGLSERICIMEKPPALLVNKLIRHPDARVGGPLLEACAAISDQVLLPVIKLGGAEKQRMIARRRELTPALCDALLEHGDPSVFLTIVRNPGASISHSAFNILNELAKSQPSLQAPLVTRGDTPAPTAFELFWFLPSELRRYVLSRFLTDSETLDKILKIALSVDGEQVRQGETDAKFPEKHQIEELSGLIHDGSANSAARMLSKLAGISQANALRIISDPDGEPLAVAMKAIGCTRAIFSKAMGSWQNSPNSMLKSERPLTELQNLFESLSFNKARVLLTYWDWAAMKSGPYARRAA